MRSAKSQGAPLSFLLRHRKFIISPLPSVDLKLISEWCDDCTQSAGMYSRRDTVTCDYPNTSAELAGVSLTQDSASSSKAATPLCAGVETDVLVKPAEKRLMELRLKHNHVTTACATFPAIGDPAVMETWGTYIPKMALEHHVLQKTLFADSALRFDSQTLLHQVHPRNPRALRASKSSKLIHASVEPQVCGRSEPPIKISREFSPFHDSVSCWEASCWAAFPRTALYERLSAVDIQVALRP